MCAINGIVGGGPDAKEVVAAMNVATSHRGPDGTALWHSDAITLGHNRLAIIDLSAAANQPLHSDSGRTTLVFNGEIYNFKELRAQLPDYQYKSNGDSEVIIAAYEKWGTDAFAKLRGMFAFALWDSASQELFLVRDQSGIKPLLWCQKGEKVYFSSELRGLLPVLPERRINRDSLKNYLRLRYVPGPHSLIEGVNKIPSASYLRVKDGVLTLKTYASVALIPTAQGSLAQTAALIDKAVASELVSDRPVGLFLSGGLDSTIVLDAATRAAGTVETFTLRFGVEVSEQAAKFNADADLAAQTAKHYKTNHHEILFTEERFIELLPEAARASEPIGNATAIAQLHLAREARKHIVVALVGDGGDELFGGYPRYKLSRLMDRYQMLPPSIRSLLNIVPVLRKLNTPPRVERVELFMFEKDEQLRRAVVGEYISTEPSRQFAAQYLTTNSSDFTQLFMDADRRSWLVDEALARTDAATMASALEARVPLLNYDLVEYASRLPNSLRQGKHHLREAFATRLPLHILNAPKRGFFSPIAKWLRRPALQKIVRTTLSPGFHPQTDALFNFNELRILLNDHVEGKTYAAPLIWSLVMFRLWAKEHNAIL
ncbi:asparagine synthase (glutamine-hydrolyzing) [Candidatus Nomurabacteria bacterium]|nr:asparagine synthase (glutamine-hydrolyzing) [Candidatus Nomurabacteria bacterium]